MIGRKLGDCQEFQVAKIERRKIFMPHHPFRVEMS